MKLIPLLVGMAKRNRAIFVMGAPSQTMDFPYIMFLVRAPSANVVIDTGIRAPEETPPFHQPYEQTEGQRVGTLLDRLGLKPNDIDIVINTHLHWDHCSNNQLFTRAKFFVQREELRYAPAPLPPHAHYYDAFELGVTPSYAGTKFEILDGDREIIDGVSVLFTPGHTPGLQSVVLTSGRRSCIIAGDNVPLYENLQGKEIGGFQPSTIYVDLESYYRSIQRVLGLGVPIIPSHDIALVEKGDLFDF